MTVTFTMDAMKAIEPAVKKKPRVEAPTVNVQSRGDEVLVWIDCRSKWGAAARESALKIREIAVSVLGTLNAEQGGYINMIASGPKRAVAGEQRRRAMIRVCGLLKIAARRSKTHKFKRFVPTAAELGANLNARQAKGERADFYRSVAEFVKANDEEARREREAAKAEREAAREKARAEREARRAEKAAKRKEAA